eukprot:NODE_151_length_17042_cov_0.275925.p4 type:complete len:278 gc:universal NODE_151_length_17042_cov_0.275925:12255-11422(-)
MLEQLQNLDCDGQFENSEVFGPEIPGLDDYRSRFCVCDKPNDDKQYYYCVTCSNWYHDACVDICKLRLNNEEDFTCSFCKNAFPCANTNCNKSAFQSFGEFQSKYCSFECTKQYIKEFIIKPLDLELESMPKRYKLSSVDSQMVSELSKEANQAESSYSKLKQLFEYYNTQLQNWPFAGGESDLLCGFSIEYIEAITTKKAIEVQTSGNICTVQGCVRHDSWRKNLLNQYVMAQAVIKIQMEHFIAIKLNCTDKINSLNQNLTSSLKNWKIKNKNLY